MTDAHYMELTLRYAEEAFARGDWPVASIIVQRGDVLGIGQNRQTTEMDITMHAETEAIRAAVRAHGLAKLVGAMLYTTMEPCPMCAFAMKLAGIGRLVLGTRHATLGRTDLGTYSIESFCAMVDYPLDITTGVREAETTALRRRWGKDSVP